MSRPSAWLARVAGPVALVTGFAAAVVAALPGTASATSGPVCYGAARFHVTRNATVTCVFRFTGAEQQFRVPAGVRWVRIDEIGGHGGFAFCPCSRLRHSRIRYEFEGEGQGMEVIGNVPVSSREMLYVEVGGNGANSAETGGARVWNGTDSPPTGGAGGWNGGGAGGTVAGDSDSPGGGGGGASDVRTVPRNTDGTLDSRVLVASGGGGEGGVGSCYFGGDGGDEDTPAGTGSTCNSLGGGAGGTVASWVSGGTGGTGGSGGTSGGATGGNGSYGLGGNGAIIGGGGGGGGYYGGGGGGGGAAATTHWSGGGGGGGGTSGSPAGDANWTYLGLTNDAAAVGITFSQTGGAGLQRRTLNAIPLPRHGVPGHPRTSAHPHSAHGIRHRAGAHPAEHHIRAGRQAWRWAIVPGSQRKSR